MIFHGLESHQRVGTMALMGPPMVPSTMSESRKPQAVEEPESDSSDAKLAVELMTGRGLVEVDLTYQVKSTWRKVQGGPVTRYKMQLRGP